MLVLSCFRWTFRIVCDILMLNIAFHLKYFSFCIYTSPLFTYKLWAVWISGRSMTNFPFFHRMCSLNRRPPLLRAWLFCPLLLATTLLNRFWLKLFSRYVLNRCRWTNLSIFNYSTWSLRLLSATALLAADVHQHNRWGYALGWRLVQSFSSDRRLGSILLHHYRRRCRRLLLFFLILRSSWPILMISTHGSGRIIRLSALVMFRAS